MLSASSDSRESRKGQCELEGDPIRTLQTHHFDVGQKSVYLPLWKSRQGHAISAKRDLEIPSRRCCLPYQNSLWAKKDKHVLCFQTSLCQFLFCQSWLSSIFPHPSSKTRAYISFRQWHHWQSRTWLLRLAGKFSLFFFLFFFFRDVILHWREVLGADV